MYDNAAPCLLNLYISQCSHLTIGPKMEKIRFKDDPKSIERLKMTEIVIITQDVSIALLNLYVSCSFFE